MKPEHPDSHHKLSSIEKQNIFSVPEDFFDELPYSIQLSVSGRIKTSPVDRLLKTLCLGMTSAIAICIFFIIGYSFSHKTPKGHETFAFTVPKGEDDNVNPSTIHYPFSYYFVSVETAKQLP